MPDPLLQSLITLDADLLQRLFDEIDACIYIKDRDERYRFVNLQVLQKFDLSREQVLGFTDQELAGEEHIPERIEEQRQVLKNGTGIDKEVGQLLRISSSITGDARSGDRMVSTPTTLMAQSLNPVPKRRAFR